MEDKKTSVLALLKILEEQTDEKHPLTQPELLEKISSIYGINLDRRTLYRNIEMLQDFGYDISTYTENGKGYYLNERNFEQSQIFLLCNAIHSSNFIPASSSKELINKLLDTQSKYVRKDYTSSVFVENTNKKENKEFFLSFEILSEAIKNKEVVSFNYTQYNLNKQLVNRRQEPYTLSPHYLVYVNGKTYLVGKSKNHDDLSHYRVDRMKNVKTIKEPYIKLSRNQDPYEYAKNKIYMYHGENEMISIKCDNDILDDIIDTFGKDVSLEPFDDKHFVAYVKSSRQGMIYLALQYIKHMEILAPVDLRQEIADILKTESKKYK